VFNVNTKETYKTLRNKTYLSIKDMHYINQNSLLYFVFSGYSILFLKKKQKERFSTIEITSVGLNRHKMIIGTDYLTFKRETVFTQPEHFFHLRQKSENGTIFLQILPRIFL
jgi:hypothetical protein